MNQRVVDGNLQMSSPWNMASWSTIDEGSEWASWLSTLGSTGCAGEPTLYTWRGHDGSSSSRNGNGMTMTVWVQARWADHPDIVSDCFSISWTADETPVVTPEETVTPTGTVSPTVTVAPTLTPVPTPTPDISQPPVLLVNGGTDDVQAPIGTGVDYSFPAGVDEGYWYAPQSEGCVGEPFDGWMDTDNGTGGTHRSTENPLTMWMQVRWTANPSLVSDCIRIEWVGEAPTPTPVVPPVLTLDGVVGDVQVPSGQPVYFTYPAGSEAAACLVWGDDTCTTAPTGTRWSNLYQGNAVYITGYHACFQARWIAHPDSMSPVLSAQWVAANQQATVLRLVAPDGSTLDGAPYNLYAETAAQEPMPAYRTGKVGSDNTIVLLDLPAGNYRLDVSPQGQETLSFSFTVAEGEEILTLQTGENPAVTPTATATATDSATTETAVAATTSASVSALPSTGSGIDHAAGLALLALSGIVLMGLAAATVRLRPSR